MGKKFITYNGTIVGDSGLSLLSIETETYSNLYSVDLDGTNDYLQTVNTFNTLDNEDTWVISSWVKFNSLVAEPLFYLTTGTGTFFTWVRSNGVIDASYNISSSYSRSTTQLQVGDWNHVCIRLFPTGNRYSMFQIWVNGVEGDTSNYFGANDFGTSSGKLYVGWNNSTGYGELNVDELAVFIGDVSPLDIYNQNNGIPGDLNEFSTTPSNWWRMGDNNDGTGTTITDQGSNGNDITLINGATFVTDVPT